MTFPPDHRLDGMLALRRDILASPVNVALERARVYTRVFEANEGESWIVCKALAFREHLRSIPLYIRDHDRIAGSISETPGAMPLHVEIGIGENGIFVGENPAFRGYLRDRVPEDIFEYWLDRNLWGQHRARQNAAGGNAAWTEVAQYKFISYQGHLSPSYGELLRVGLDGLLAKVLRRRRGEDDPDSINFLDAVENALAGVIEWTERYADILEARARECPDEDRRVELFSMSRICAKIAHAPPTPSTKRCSSCGYATRRFTSRGTDTRTRPIASTSCSSTSVSATSGATRASRSS